LVLADLRFAKFVLFSIYPCQSQSLKRHCLYRVCLNRSTAPEFYDYKAKYISKDTQYICPCGLDDDALSILEKLVEKAFSTLGCKSWGRVDLMRDEYNNWYLLEVNTVPGLTDTSLVPKAAIQVGISFEKLIFKILLQVVDLNSSK
jgi:D-alanine-D-alanine ligase